MAQDDNNVKTTEVSANQLLAQCTHNLIMSEILLNEATKQGTLSGRSLQVIVAQTRIEDCKLRVSREMNNFLTAMKGFIQATVQGTDKVKINLKEENNIILGGN